MQKYIMYYDIVLYKFPILMNMQIKLIIIKLILSLLPYLVCMKEQLNLKSFKQWRYRNRIGYEWVLKLRRHHTHTSPTGKQLFLGRELFLGCPRSSSATCNTSIADSQYNTNWINFSWRSSTFLLITKYDMCARRNAFLK